MGLLDPSTGVVHPLPCGRMGCPFCSRRLCEVNAWMLGLDAADSGPCAPSVYLTTTTRDPITSARFNDATRQMVRRVRLELAPAAKYAGTIEFTTGRGTRSGGLRRPHQHLVWKGLVATDTGPLEEIATDVWTRIAGAHSHVAEEIRSAGHVLGYIARHHLKESQAPPPGWQGRRLRTSKGYYETPAAALRERARVAARDSKLLYRLVSELAEEAPGFELSPDWDDVLDGRLAAAKGRAPWRVVRAAAGFAGA